MYMFGIWLFHVKVVYALMMMMFHLEVCPFFMLVTIPVCLIVFNTVVPIKRLNIFSLDS